MKNIAKIDIAAFSHGKMTEETEKHDYSHLSNSEQAEIFNYLMNVTYGFVGKSFPRMDKTKFEIGKR